jgi:hypothetical protein
LCQNYKLFCHKTSSKFFEKKRETFFFDFLKFQPFLFLTLRHILGWTFKNSKLFKRNTYSLVFTILLANFKQTYEIITNFLWTSHAHLTNYSQFSYEVITHILQITYHHTSILWTSHMHCTNYLQFSYEHRTDILWASHTHFTYYL